MNLNDLTLQIEDMQGRVTQLQQQAHLKSSQPQQLNIIVTALAELGLALEELQITTNEKMASLGQLERHTVLSITLTSG